MMVRRAAAEEIGWFDPAFFVYSDETDFCRAFTTPAGACCSCPQAEAVHHDQLSTDAEAMRRRIVEFHRGRDLYFRKHRMPVARALWRICWTWAYLARALAATVLPGHSPRRYLAHARQQLNPDHGEGLRELAEEYNRRLACSALTCRAVAHADTAQLAAVGGALGSALAAARARPLAAAGRAAAAGRRRAGPGALARRRVALQALQRGRGAAAAVAGLLLVAGAAAVLAWRPALVSIVVLVARPSGRRSTSPARIASWYRSPPTGGWAGSCRSTSSCARRRRRWAGAPCAGGRCARCRR